MNTLYSLTIVVHIFLGFGIIGLVLLQHGKGADMGAAFGSGASGSLFGATGAANFLSRTTAVLAAAFFFTSLLLAYTVSNQPRNTGSVVDNAVQSQALSPPPAPAMEGQGAESANKAAAPSDSTNGKKSKAEEIPQ
ncbi:MAG: preprotein translocase subunit SecG [Betaproteobacteria bacterium]|nr:preprotein translocase subunit SecG [Betaproteobacteria bacterium]